MKRNEVKAGKSSFTAFVTMSVMLVAVLFNLGFSAKATTTSIKQMTTIQQIEQTKQENNQTMQDEKKQKIETETTMERKARTYQQSFNEATNFWILKNEISKGFMENEVEGEDFIYAMKICDYIIEQMFKAKIPDTRIMELNDFASDILGEDHTYVVTQNVIENFEGFTDGVLYYVYEFELYHWYCEGIIPVVDWNEYVRKEEKIFRETPNHTSITKLLQHADSMFKEYLDPADIPSFVK